MFLSRIQLTSALAQQSQLGLLLQDRSYGLHRLLWDLFPQGERFIFREENALEQGADSKRYPLYYVLSQTLPKIDNPIFDVQSKPYEPKLEGGDKLMFKLRANPTVARKQEGVKNSRRHDVIMDAQKQFLIAQCKVRNLPIVGQKSELKKSLFLHVDFKDAKLREALLGQLQESTDKAAADWLYSRAEARGFSVDSLQATAYQWHALPEKGRKAGFSTMDYEGVLTVTDPVLLSATLANGLGPSKAFGCGLLLIRRH